MEQKQNETSAETRFKFEIVPVRDIKNLLIGFYILLTGLLFMINESTSTRQWLLFVLVLALTAFFGAVYFYRRAIESSQWLAITISEFGLILSGASFFVAGALESSKKMSNVSCITVPALLFVLINVIIYVYLNLKDHKEKST
jgi:Kef-type K+ transport system membrane component KefB